MKIKLHVSYNTNWGQIVCVCGSVDALGNGNEKQAAEMRLDSGCWVLDLELKGKEGDIQYHYLVKEQGNVVSCEWGNEHQLKFEKDKIFEVYDEWQTIPPQKFFYTSGFSESFFAHKDRSKVKLYKNTILLKVNCPCVKQNQTLVLSGASKTLGEWKIEGALKLTSVSTSEWQIAINASAIKSSSEYKLAILDNVTHKIVNWEEGSNRLLLPLTKGKESVQRVESFAYRHAWVNWKAAGVSIPVFSLRSNDSFGIGEFSDLKKMVDWTALTGQKIIQILPINDTTITYTWVDSYPYNAISIYALHPIYLGLKSYPLKDQKQYKKYEKEASKLNQLEVVDYEKVLSLKWKYLNDLFAESGQDILQSKEYAEFYQHNEEWLFPYACFSYLRDKYSTADYRLWKTHSSFDRKKLQKLVQATDVKAKIDLLCFTQYLLHKQLVEVKEYAHQHEVILKGDIPIGISRNSVEAWVEPHLFNLDVQTGAPPDDFSFFGQNWGFPTYNWEEMAKDGYQWWIKRFRKMADYFDAYRIDHILGFFRIWEIPLSSVQGLLGYFSPALPLTVDEIRSYGLWFDEDRMLKPYIHESYLNKIFGAYTHEIIVNYLQPIDWQRYDLKDECNTQVKIKELFSGCNDDKSKLIRDGLYGLCNEVLFIRDKREPNKYHPRITAQYSYSYKHLDNGARAVFNNLYNDFFYRRHSRYWRDEAMKKLPALIASTSMLVCGEDLGMVPESVPSVMNELQILSLEIERMPKEREADFNILKNLPYYSVCTTSTHDMSPIRLWWKEDRAVTQKYYNQILWKQGVAPEECSSDLCWQIIINHLDSPAMLAILPLQDWLSIDDRMKRENAEEERINEPAISQHYWQYRMHLTLEELMEANGLNNRLRVMIESSGRK